MNSSQNASPTQPISPPARQKTGGMLINWVDGRPIPVYSHPLNKQQVSDLVTSALSLQYTGEIDTETGEPVNFDSRFMGMTNAEVMAIRLAEKAASGDHKATEQLLDRILGKPKQSVETVGVKMNYKDFLDVLAGNPEIQDKAEFSKDVSLDKFYDNLTQDAQTITVTPNADDDWLDDL